MTKEVDLTGSLVPPPEFFMVSRIAGGRSANLTADEKRIAAALGIAADWEFGCGIYDTREDAAKVAAVLQDQTPGEVIVAIGSREIL